MQLLIAFEKLKIVVKITKTVKDYVVKIFFSIYCCPYYI